jgi:hypothetical protein
MGFAMTDLSMVQPRLSNQRPIGHAASCSGPILLVRNIDSAQAVFKQSSAPNNKQHSATSLRSHTLPPTWALLHLIMALAKRRDVSPILIQADSAFFRLCYDVHVIIYEHMNLPPFSSEDECRGFVLSCHLACFEAKEAAATALSKSFANDLRLVERRAADQRIYYGT